MGIGSVVGEKCSESIPCTETSMISPGDGTWFSSKIHEPRENGDILVETGLILELTTSMEPFLNVFSRIQERYL